MIGVLYVSFIFLEPEAMDQDMEELQDYEPSGPMVVIAFFFDIFKWMYIAITCALLFSVRRSIRRKYAIPGDDRADCCWSFWCPCLVAGQLLRHTTDYDVYPSRMFTETGLPESAATIV